jgi:arabinose-5-phosphate isomerase
MKSASQKSGIGESVVRIEAEALRALAERLAGPMAVPFEHALDLLHQCKGRVVVTGMGKSGLVARKIAATLSSTGTPSLFLHPAEAVHGDLGMLVRGDLVIALSSSGETEEILRLLATIKRLGLKLIAMTGEHLYPDPATGHSAREMARNAATRNSARNSAVYSANQSHSAEKEKGKTTNGQRSTLAAAADVALDCSIAQEACSLGLAPTASTTTMLALGDALAVALAERRGFREEDFADLHPGGKLGKKLARVSSLMHSGEAVPRVSPETGMSQVIYEMSRKGLGVTAVVEGERLVGIISDGDLRRLLEKRGKDALDILARDCMTRHPQTIAPDEFAAAALSIMEQKKITSLAVVDSGHKLQGMVHLHDLWGMEMV